MRNLQRLEPTKKLAMKYAGPYKVEKAVGAVSYRLKLPETLPIHPVFHASLLKPYRRKEYPGRPINNEPPPVLTNTQPEWEVERIETTKRSRGKVLYLVRWKGYDAKDNTLEPLANLENAATLVKNFHERYPEAERPPNLTQWLNRHGPKRK